MRPKPKAALLQCELPAVNTLALKHLSEKIHLAPLFWSPTEHKIEMLSTQFAESTPTLQ